MHKMPKNFDAPLSRRFESDQRHSKQQTFLLKSNLDYVDHSPVLSNEPPFQIPTRNLNGKSTKNRLKSGSREETTRSDEERLRKAQEAYEEIMRSLNASRSPAAPVLEKKSRNHRSTSEVTQQDGRKLVIERKADSRNSKSADILHLESEMVHQTEHSRRSKSEKSNPKADLNLEFTGKHERNSQGDSRKSDSRNSKPSHHLHQESEFVNVSDPLQRNKTEMRVLNSNSRLRMDIPDIAFEELERSSRMVNASPKYVKHSSSSVRAVKSLQSALKPVKLEHPNWVQDDLESGRSERRTEEKSRYENHNNHDNIGKSSKNGIHRTSGSDVDISSRSSEQEEDDVDPRKYISNLWNGYQLKYPRGKVGTPKWQPKENDRKLEQPSPSRLKKSQENAIPPRITIQKENRNVSRRNSEIVDLREEDKSIRSWKSGGKLKSVSKSADVVEEEEDAKSDATWDVRREASPWDDIEDDYRRPEIQEDAGSRRSHSARSSHQVRQEPALPSFPPAPVIKPRRPLVRTETNASRLRCRSLERYLAEKTEKTISDLAEMKNQFRANPLPAWIVEPKYDRLVEESNERKKKMHRRAQEMLEQVQPFTFSKIPSRKRVFSSLPSTGNDVSRREGHSKSNPESAIGSKVRTIRSFPVPSRYAEPRHACDRHAPPDPPFRPAINASVPDFRRLHAEMDRKLNSVKNRHAWSTVPRPFHLTPPQPAHQHNHDDGRDAGRPPKTTDRKLRKSRSTERSFEEIVKPTRAFSMMAQHSRQRLDKEKDEETSWGLEKRIELDRFRSSLNKRFEELSDASGSKAIGKGQRVEEMEKNSRDYFEQLEEIKRRLDDRPFLWEQTLMESKRKQIDEKFEEIIEDYQVKDILDRYSHQTSSSTLSSR